MSVVNQLKLGSKNQNLTKIITFRSKFALTWRHTRVMYPENQILKSNYLLQNSVQCYKY